MQQRSEAQGSTNQAPQGQPRPIAKEITNKKVSGWFALATLLPIGLPLIAPAAFANPVRPAQDGTGTVVTVNGQQFNISGGRLSGNGANLFHSFSQFGLSQGQIANFLSNPNIQNILSRVNSNNPSIINGLLQVTGGRSNLYLINPSGIIFGPNASLNVPAAFIATTANGIQFGDRWFSATGNNNYATLNGNPTAMAFAVNQPGAIVNAGNLQVQAGQNLSLVGGAVVNVGTVAAPGGEVTIAAVPGQSAVRISQTGSVLSLELPLQPGNQPNQLQVPPLSLAELLTGGQAAGVNTGVAVTPTGQIQVAGTTVANAPGTAIVSGQVSVANPSGVGGTVQVLGQNVALLSANINASGQTGGGTVLVGGDYLGQGSTPTALRTLVDANSRIFADALRLGDGGKVIAWANDLTQFGGQIFARGGVLGGNGGLVETSGKNTLVVAPTAQVNASAVNGLAGQWLLDPTNINIANIGGTITPGTIISSLNSGTNVSLTTGGAGLEAGDITLTDSISQAGGGNASLTLTGRQFLRPGAATISMNSTGGLTFNLNQINPETSAPMSSIQAAHDAIGAVAGARTINLFAPTSGTVTFAGATLNLNRNVTITGANGASRTILDGQNSRRVVTVNNGTNIRLDGLTITGGSVPLPDALSGVGGGINIGSGNVTIANSVIRNNVAVSGGGIGSSGSLLTITNTQIQNNTATGAGPSLFQGGGGIVVGNTNPLTPSRLVLTDSTVSNNVSQGVGAGGVAVLGILNMTGSTISQNTVTLTNGVGGGLVVGGLATITDSTIANNRAVSGGGGIFSVASLTITGSTISGNAAGEGGGILNVSGGSIPGITIPATPGVTPGVLNIVNSRLTGNSATLNDGGAISNVGALSLTNSTVSNNIAAVNGGGIFNDTGISIGGINLSGPGTVNVVGSNFTGNSSSTNGGGIFNSNSLTVSNSTFSGNSTGSGGGILNEDGSLNVTSSTFSGNTVRANGGGIWTSGNATISASTITANSAGGHGGGVDSVYNDSNTRIANSTISGNTARTEGGGVHGHENGTVTIVGSTIASNSAGTLGGGIFSRGLLVVENSSLLTNRALAGGGIANAATVTFSGGVTTIGVGSASITGSTISGNTATLGQGQGGGILNLSVLSLANSTLSSNSASGSGGGLANASSIAVSGTSFSGTGVATVTNSRIEQNRSTGFGGGGLANNNNASLSITGSTISANTASDRGGGIFNAGGLGVQDSVISNNSVTGSNSAGGGLWNSGTANIAGSTFTGNFAPDHAGGIDTFANARTTISNSAITNNTAGSSGGGLFVHDTGTLTVLNSSILNNRANSANGGDAFFTQVGSTTNISGTVPVTGSLAFNGTLNLQSNIAWNSTTSSNVTSARFADINGQGLNLAASGNVEFNGNVNGLPNATLTVTTPGRILSGATSVPYFLYYGTVNLQAAQGINLPNYILGALGDLDLFSSGGNITTGPLASLNGDIFAFTPVGNLLIGAINPSGSGAPVGGVFSQRGLVALLAPAGTIRVTGVVNTGPAAGASIYSGSTVIINVLNTPTRRFTVGDATINGTAGPILTPSDRITTSSFTNEFIAPGRSIAIVLPRLRPESCDVSNTCNPLPPEPPEEPGGPIGSPTAFVTPPSPLSRLERNNCLEFQEYFGSDFGKLVGQDNPCNQELDLASLQNQLRTAEKETGQKSAIIYIAEAAGIVSINAYFAEGQPINRIVPQSSLVQIEALANELRDEVAPFTAGGTLIAGNLATTSYLDASQKLYRLLIAPIAADLEAQGTQVLIFSMGRGLRGIPLAALHDGKQFLIEKYAIGTIPSLNLTQTSYAKNLRGGQMLAMGASQWASRGIQGVPDLPSVPTELSLVSRASGLTTQTFLNPQFTTTNLVRERTTNPFRVVHLATHGEFLPGQPAQSFIRFWDSNVSLEQMRQLKLDAPSIDLLTLSACKTAAGDEQAELGFAGMAIAAGVKTTLASLWYVSDVSTMALMSNFYSNLQTATTKAQALQQTQLAMLRGQTRIDGSNLRLGNQTITLTPEQAQEFNSQLRSLGVRDFSHPYFWSAFTMVGSPW